MEVKIKFTGCKILEIGYYSEMVVDKGDIMYPFNLI